MSTRVNRYGQAYVTHLASNTHHYFEVHVTNINILDKSSKQEAQLSKKDCATRLSTAAQ